MYPSRDSLPGSIIRHLHNAAEAFGLEADEDTIARLGAGWLEKRDAFDNMIIEKGMDDIGFFSRNDERGALILTYSGSLVSVGPLDGDDRKITYTSIGFRTDVPPSLHREGCILSSDGKVDTCLSFQKGPIKQTSRIFRIAVCPESLSAVEQSELLSSTSSVIAESFLGMNRDLMQNR
jgi:hypothetical protein